MKNPKRKNRRGSGGFSLSEVLVSILIVTLVSILLVSGMGTIMNTYHKSVNAANAQTLISTVITELRNELTYASDVSCSNDTISYRNSDGLLCTIANGSSGTAQAGTAADTYPGLCLTVGSTSKELVSSEASTVLACRISGVFVNSTASEITIGRIAVFEAGKTNVAPLTYVDNLTISVQTVTK